MNIIDAVTEATKTGNMISRGIWKKEGLNWGIFPTNSLPCFIVKGEETHGHWNPCVEDILATDWTVLER